MMFIRAYAEPAGGTAIQRAINRQLGIGRTDRQGAFYRRTGLSGIGATPRTRGRLTAIRPVTRGR